MKTKIFHIVENFDNKYGGVNVVVKSIVNNINLYKHEVINIKNKLLTISQIKKIFCSKNKKKIIHIHGIFNPTFLFVALLSIFFNIKFTVSSHGNLKEITWKQKGLISYLFKYTYWNFFAKYILKKAFKVHAVEKIEFNNLKTYFQKNKISTIYHMYNFDNNKTKYKINKNLIFIGRIAALKGIEILIDCFSKIKKLKNFNLVIYGPVVDIDYFNNLRNQIDEKKLSNRILFKKPVTGKQKNNILRASWAFVNASKSEVLGFTNFEAARSSLPIIASTNFGLGELKNNGGITVNPTVLNFKRAIEVTLKWSLKKRIKNGKKINNFFKKKFSMKSAVKKWNRFYEI